MENICLHCGSPQVEDVYRNRQVKIQCYYCGINTGWQPTIWNAHKIWESCYGINQIWESCYGINPSEYDSLESVLDWHQTMQREEVIEDCIYFLKQQGFEDAANELGTFE